MLPAEFINKKHTENPEKRSIKTTGDFFPFPGLQTIVYMPDNK